MLCFILSVTHLYPAKTTERIKLLFGEDSWGSRMGIPMTHGKGEREEIRCEHREITLGSGYCRCRGLPLIFMQIVSV